MGRTLRRLGYYLFYSGNWWESHTYAVGYAVCETVTGPCVKPQRAPIFEFTKQAMGPGGEEFFRDAEGNLWMAYHAWTAPLVGYPEGERSLRIEPVTFVEGIPTIPGPQDGCWYLFFAKDFFDERVGTGLETAGPVTTVLRASADWQIYERNRTIYNQHWAAWHTVEGPFVLWHEGLYYCFYSGGAWHSTDYGVSYGVAEQVLGPYRDTWSVQGPAVLRTIPDQVLGPGHNSIITGPDGRTPFLVYHAWDQQRIARRMCIDPLTWTAEGPRCAGPTTAVQTI